MTLRAAVLGHPIGHSLSPLIHTHWIARYGVDASYAAIDVPPDDLGETVRRLIREDYVGFNVTLPHKMTVMQYCDSVDEPAGAIGAVNAVRISDGKLHGFNTDVFGFSENLRRQCPDWRPEQGAALVLGAGGAARAVIQALLDAGVPQIIIANRSLDKAQDLAMHHSGITAVPWEHRNRAVSTAGLIVNTTSLGMAGQDELMLDLSGAGAGTVVADIVYKPLVTPLLAQAAGLGLPAVTGLGMLLHQARPAFAAWFDILPEVDDALAALAAAKAAAS